MKCKMCDEIVSKIIKTSILQEKLDKTTDDSQLTECDDTYVCEDCYKGYYTWYFENLKKNFPKAYNIYKDRYIKMLEKKFYNTDKRTNK